ncbi:MAG: tetratricopeptide repeat protein, partial [Armatimonadetes bacterium]|nr:tetratricopeptide repeat protein [Armatimonadota bacterium]
AAAAASLENARRALSEGSLKAALSSALLAVKMDPLSAEGWEILGLLHRQAGQPREAEHALRRLLYLDPEWPLAHFHLAALFREANRPDDARREYANAARLLAAMPPDTVVGGVTADLMLRACRQFVESAG